MSVATANYNFFHSLFRNSLRPDPATCSNQSVMKFQMQSPELFYKKRCSSKFRKIYRKTPVPEFLFNKDTNLGHLHLFHRTPTTASAKEILVLCIVCLNASLLGFEFRVLTQTLIFGVIN